MGEERKTILQCKLEFGSLVCFALIVLKNMRQVRQLPCSYIRDSYLSYQQPCDKRRASFLGCISKVSSTDSAWEDSMTNCTFPKTTNFKHYLNLFRIDTVGFLNKGMTCSQLCFRKIKLAPMRKTGQKIMQLDAEKLIRR